MLVKELSDAEGFPGKPQTRNNRLLQKTSSRRISPLSPSRRVHIEHQAIADAVDGKQVDG